MLLPLLFLLALVHALPPPSNLRLRLNRPGFDFLSGSAHRVIDEEVPKIDLPNLTVPIDKNGNVYTYQTKIDKFSSPRFQFSLSNQGLHWHSRDGAVKISSLFTVEYFFIIQLSQSGWFTALATDLRIDLSATATTLDGRPQVSILGCSTDITGFDFQIGGGVLTWLVNLFSPLLSNSIRGMINDQSCSFARDFVLREGNSFLHSLPVDVSLGDGFFLHYHIDRDPSFDPRFAELESSVTVTYGNESSCTSLPTPLDHLDPSPPMATIWLSEQIPNCLLESAFTHINISLPVNHENLPLLEKYLKTSCFFTCIGFFFPLLRSQYPNEHVALVFTPISPPVLSFLPELEAVGAVTPSIRNHHITGTIGEISINATEVFSSIGEFSQSFLTRFSSIFDKIVSGMMGVVLNKGLPIPAFDNLTLADSSQISLLPRQLRLSLDFQEVNSATKKKKNGKKHRKHHKKRG